jgi:DeoR/GlpR family transcriptional regulator of sugar metabolism
MRALRGRDVRIVTNSLDVLCELASAPGQAIHAIGGSFRQDARSFIGPAAVESVRRFHYDRAFLGTSGISLAGVLSSQNAIESELKQAVISQSERIVVVADSSKLGHQAFSIFARSEEVHVIVTDETSETRELAERVACEVVLVQGRAGKKSVEEEE